MSQFVVIDADFLSAFLKIERLPLIVQFYQIDEIVLAPAVYREVAQTTLLPALSVLKWIRIETPPIAALDRLRRLSEYNQLGAGEQESIALTLNRAEASLLCNDNRARRFAQGMGIEVVNIAAFLLAAKISRLIELNDLQIIIAELGRLDHYRFRADVLAQLLS